jgi:hypothetical protein
MAIEVGIKTAMKVGHINGNQNWQWQSKLAMEIKIGNGNDKS